MTLAVDSYAGYRGEETPRRFCIEGRWVAVDEILGRWRIPEHCYFKVRSEDGATCTLRQDVASGTWELHAISS